jgi:hypothetical protein
MTKNWINASLSHLTVLVKSLWDFPAFAGMTKNIEGVL